MASMVYSSRTPWLAMTKRESCGRRCWWRPKTPPADPPPCWLLASQARDGANAAARRMGTSSGALVVEEDEGKDFLRLTDAAEPDLCFKIAMSKQRRNSLMLYVPMV